MNMSFHLVRYRVRGEGAKLWYSIHDDTDMDTADGFISHGPLLFPFFPLFLLGERPNQSLMESR
jgi:hypothetical protein